MARKVLIDLRDHAGVPAGTGSARDKVTVWAPEFRPSVEGAWVVGPTPKDYFFVGGKVTIPGVEEGPLVVQFSVRQFEGADTFHVDVPAGTTDITLRELLASEYEYSPIVITEAQRVLGEARSLMLLAQSERAAAQDAAAAAQAERERVEGQLSQKADVSHTHTIANVTGLQAALDGKAPTAHTHTIANVTNLQATLDGKAAASHTHLSSHVTDSVAVAGATADAGKLVKIAADGQLQSSVNPTALNHLARKAYVDTQVATRAAASHTHTVSQLTDLKVNTVTVQTEAEATALTGLRKGDFVVVLDTGNVYKEV